MNPNIIKKYEGLDKRVRETSKEFYHSRPLVEYRVDGKEVSMDLRSLLLNSACTGNNVLLAGDTGSAKTHLAIMVNVALFGNNGWRKS